MPEEKKIIIDEDWKQEAQREKEALAKAVEADKKPQHPALPPANILVLLQSLATQALMGLGDLENPFTGQRELHLEEAKFNIDLLDVLEQKTKGNLTEQEAKLLEALLYDLRLRYVDVANAQPRQQI